MKNKEIEELLNRLKDNNDWYVIENKEEHNTEPYKLLLPTERNLLLSYIEQLKNNYIEANENITWWTNRFNAVERDNRNLKNNRDKAIEEINYLINTCDISDYQGEKLKNILKGDSE